MPAGLSDTERDIADQIISVFENSTTEIQYAYAENLDDGRGITAGRAGFTSATSDMLEVISRYTAVVSDNVLAGYVPRLEVLAASESDSTDGLEGLESAWAQAAEDPLFRFIQDQVVDEWYYQPAMDYADELGVSDPLTLLALYDTIIQHGDGDDPDSLSALIEQTTANMGGTPADGVDEEAYLREFLAVRRADLLNPHDASTQEEWAESVDRVDTLTRLLDAGNTSLTPPFSITTYGDMFDIAASATDDAVGVQLGDDGADSLTGDDGPDALYGQGGSDRLLGGAGDDSMFGQVGNDRVFGEGGNDELYGGNGADTLRGDAGNDTLVGGAGADGLWAGSADDTIGGGVGNDLLAGDNGTDILFGGGGNDTVVGGSWTDGEADTAETSGNEIWAGAGADLVWGADGNDMLGGGNDNDQLNGAGGNDIIYAGKTGDDTLHGGAGADTLYGGSGTDILDGGDGADVLFGGTGDDLLAGGSGDDTLYGGAGADTLDGGAGNDTLRGGDGADVFVFDGASGEDVLYGFATAEDLLDLSTTAANFASLADVQAAASQTSDGLLIDLGGGNSLLLVDATLADLTASNLVFD